MGTHTTSNISRRTAVLGRVETIAVRHWSVRFPIMKPYLGRNKDLLNIGVDCRHQGP